MSKSDRSRVIPLVEAQASIPAGEHAVIVFRRGPLDIALSLPCALPSRRRTQRMKFISSFGVEECSPMMAGGTRSAQATSSS
jgi:hypothetical protein